MADITTRSGKGSALTHSELDDNFSNLNNDKVESLSDLSVTATADEINVLDGITASTEELNILDGKTFADEDDMSSDSATAIPSQQSVKAYVDANAGSYDLDIRTDDNTTITVTDSETLVVFGGEGIETSSANNTVNISGAHATTTTKGVASFDSNDFTVTSGRVSLASGAGMSDIVEDTTPQLGGDLDLNNNDITGTGNINITGNVSLTGTVDGRDVAADGTKLDGIATGAEVNTVDSVNTQTGAVVLDADDISDTTTTNKFTTAADISKLAGIEAGATADQTAAEIRTLVESAIDSNVFTDADHTKLDGIEASADVTDTDNVVASLTAGTNITIASDGTISATDTNTQLTNEEVQDIVGAMLAGNTETGITVTYQDVDGTIDFVVDSQTDENFTTALKNKLDAIEAGATADQTAAEIRALVDAATDSNVFTDADHSKLDGIESGATADQTAAEIRTLVESATDSNVFTDADHTKLNGIEANATADQTAAEIRTLVESATDSNVFTDADHTKLNGIEALADVTDTANVTAAGALMDSELTNEAAVKAIDQGLATTDSPTFADITITGGFTVSGEAIVEATLLADLQGITHTGLSADEIVRVHGRTAAGDGYEGEFKWVTGNQSANVTADSEKAIWVAPTGASTGASGAWKRIYDGHTYHARWFGAKGDGSTNDTDALIKAFAYLDHGDTMDLENLEYSVWHVGSGTGEYDLADHIPNGSSNLSGILDVSEVIRVAHKAHITVRNGFLHAYAEGKLGADQDGDRREPLGSGGSQRYFPSILNFELCYNLKLENLKVHARSSRYGVNPASSAHPGGTVSRSLDEKMSDAQTAFGCACVIYECYEVAVNDCEFKYAGDVAAMYSPGAGQLTFTNCFAATNLFEGSAFNSDAWGGHPENAQYRAFNSTSLGDYKHLLRFTTVFEASYSGLSGTFVNNDLLSFSGGAKAKFVGIDTGSSKIYFATLNEDGGAVASGNTVTGGTSSASVTLTSAKSVFIHGDDKFNVYYNECSSYFTNYVTDGTAARASAKACIAIEDHSVNAYITGGYYANARDFSSATTLGSAFTAGRANLVRVSDAVVEDCKYVLRNALGDHDTQAYLSNVRGERIHVGAIYSQLSGNADPVYIQADNCYFSIQDAKYSFDDPAAVPQYNSADYPTFIVGHKGSQTSEAQLGVVLNNCTSFGADTLVVAPDLIEPVTQPFETSDQQAGTTTNLYADASRSVGLVVNGGSHTVKNRIIDVAAWGYLSDPGVNAAGIEIMGGAKFDVTNTGTIPDSVISLGVSDRSAVIASYNKPKDGGSGDVVYQYINIDPTVAIKVYKDRTIYNNSVTNSVYRLRFDRNAIIERAHEDSDAYTEYNVGKLVGDVAELSGGVTYDPSGGGVGTDTATDVGIALTSGTRIVGTQSGYIRSLFEWNNNSDITIGQGGTSLIQGINLLAGSSGDAKVNGNRILTVADEGAGNGLDADTLDGYQTAANGAVNTIPIRNASGDIFARLLRSTYPSQTGAPATTARIAFRNDNGSSDNYIRTVTNTGFVSWLNNQSGLDADTVDGLQGSSFLRSDAADTASGNITFSNGLTLGAGAGSYINHNNTASRDKIRLWNNSLYAIGMDNAMSYGHLNEYSMTFQMGGATTRGWVFLDTSHSDSQGAMSLTLDGKMTVATSLSVGEGESVTSPSSDTLHVEGSASISASSASLTIDNYAGSPNQTLLNFQADMGTNDRGFQIKSPTTDSSSAPFRFTTGNAFAFELDGSDALTIASNKRVGIGTSSPSSLLHLKSNAPYITFEDDDNNQDWQIQATAWFAIRDQSAGTERMRIDSSGNVGIGTDQPDQLVHLYASNPILNMEHFQNGSSRIYFESTTDGNWGAINASNASGNRSIGITPNSATGDTRFGGLLLGTSGATIGGVFDTDYGLNVYGNVGIGTSSPSSTLDVQGDIIGSADLTIGDSIRAAAGGATRINFSNASTLAFDTAGVERMRIDSSGNVGIGTTSPSSPLDVNGQAEIGTNGNQLRLNSTAGIAIFEGNSTEYYLRNKGTGKMSFQQGSSNTERMYLTNTGTLYVDGTYQTFSDERLKDNIEPIESALEKVSSLTGVTFTRKEAGDKSTGLIAQDVEKVLPEAVQTNDAGYKTVAYGNTVGLLVEAIKELRQEVADLKKQLEEK